MDDFDNNYHEDTMDVLLESLCRLTWRGNNPFRPLTQVLLNGVKPAPYLRASRRGDF